MTESSRRFADWEPEDSWSPGDQVYELLDNLDARCVLLGEPSRINGDDVTFGERLDDIIRRLRHWEGTKASGASGRDWQRADDIARHIDFVKARIRSEPF